MLLAVPAPRSIDDQLDALFGQWLVQEAIHHASADLRRENRLILATAGDHQYQIRKLLFQAFGELGDRAGDGRGIDDDHSTAGTQQVDGEVRFGGDDCNASARRDRMQCREQCPILRERDEVFLRARCQRRIAGQDKQAFVVRSGGARQDLDAPKTLGRSGREPPAV